MKQNSVIGSTLYRGDDCTVTFLRGDEYQRKTVNTKLEDVLLVIATLGLIAWTTYVITHP